MTSRKDVEARLIEKATGDPRFRADLVADPRSAIEREFGVNLPAGTRVTVLEEKPDQHYLVLPLNPETAQLGATQLDAVSAGGCYPDCSCDESCPP